MSDSIKRVVITGGPGFGKTSVIRELESRGYMVFHEYSRQVLEEQKSNEGEELPWKDHYKFHNRLYEGRVNQYHEGGALSGIVFYDRGLPDSLAYLVNDGLPVPEEQEAEARVLLYYPVVFVVPPWPEIYATDRSRWEEFPLAEKIHLSIVNYYVHLGYRVMDIPRLPVPERADFILSQLADADEKM